MACATSAVVGRDGSSDQGRTLLTRHGYDPDDPLTFLVLDGERYLTQSDAWIHLVTAAGGWWRLAYAAGLFPGRCAMSCID